ncbi:MAG: CAAD domain-containing protein [Geitlerinemataceae cyanobacterium]
MEPKPNPDDRASTPNSTEVSELIDKVVEFIAEAPSILAYTWNTYQRPIINVALVLALLSAIVAIFDFLGSVNQLIFFPTFFTVLGIIQAVRFGYRNVLFAKDRQKLLQQVRSVKQELTGSSSVALLAPDETIEVTAIAVNEPAAVIPTPTAEEMAIVEVEEKPEILSSPTVSEVEEIEKQRVIESLATPVEAVNIPEETGAVLVPEQIETRTDSELTEDEDNLIPDVLPAEVAAISVEEETVLDPEPLNETTIIEEVSVAETDSKTPIDSVVESNVESNSVPTETVEESIEESSVPEENKTPSTPQGFEKKTQKKSLKESVDEDEVPALATEETTASPISTQSDLDDLLFSTNGVDELRYLFIGSQVELIDSPEKLEGLTHSQTSETLGIGVVKAEGKKCDRCWNYSTSVGKSSEHPTVCDRCVAALNGKF